MAITNTSHRQSIHKIYADFYRITGGLALVIIGIWMGSLMYSDGYATNVYTEMLSVFATIAFLDQINQWRDRRALKERLMNEVKSPAMGQATAALAWLRRENWIAHDTFKNSDLQNINWTNAYIGDLSLEGSNLRRANLQRTTNETSHPNEEALQEPVMLQHANLRLSQLQDATLAGANFQQADLHSANLDNAYLRDASLLGANLRRAKLRGTVLTNADLRGANLSFAILENNKCILLDGTHPTILPDGELWTPQTDLEKFTNPKHPDFESTLEKINAIRNEMGIDALS